MKKYSIIFLLLVVSFSCSQEKISNKYAETITSKDLQNLLVTYSSDKFEGRQTGEYGEMLAVNFLRDFYIKNELFNLYSKSHLSKLKNTSLIEYIK